MEQILLVLIETDFKKFKKNSLLYACLMLASKLLGGKKSGVELFLNKLCVYKKIHLFDHVTYEDK